MVPTSAVLILRTQATSVATVMATSLATVMATTHMETVCTTLDTATAARQTHLHVTPWSTEMPDQSLEIELKEKV